MPPASSDFKSILAFDAPQAETCLIKVTNTTVFLRFAPKGGKDSRKLLKQIDFLLSADLSNDIRPTGKPCTAPKATKSITRDTNADAGDIRAFVVDTELCVAVRRVSAFSREQQHQFDRPQRGRCSVQLGDRWMPDV